MKKIAQFPATRGVEFGRLHIALHMKCVIRPLNPFGTMHITAQLGCKPTDTTEMILAQQKFMKVETNLMPNTVCIIVDIPLTTKVDEISITRSE